MTVASRRVDVAIVGGGPAGLAAAIVAAARGLHAAVFERRRGPPDKACGEGLMPSGVRALEALGARGALPPDGFASFVGIRYLQEDGSAVAARFPEGCGLGIRRLALSQALERRAVEMGAEVHFGAAVRGIVPREREVLLQTDGGEIRARLAIAADGLGSPIRRMLGLDGAPPRRRRFGLRRHYAIAPWSDHVEVHWANGAEAYVTPVGPRRVGIAFLWDERRLGPQRFGVLLARFPDLADRLAGALPEGGDRGAGPLERSARRRSAGRVLLLGDAGGYVDALSGEGLSLAFEQAIALGPHLADAVVRGGPALQPWLRAAEAGFRRYAARTRALLLLSEAPALRRRIFRLLAARPQLFAAALGVFADAAPDVRPPAPRPRPLRPPKVDPGAASLQAGGKS